MRGLSRIEAGVGVLLVAVGCGGGGDAAGNGRPDSGGAGSGGGTAGAGGAGGATGSAGADAGSDADAGFPPPAPEGCVDDASPGDHAYTCDGIVYDVSVPDACATSACGLVFDVHGFSMNAAMEEANTHLAALGKQYGYIVVQPNAPGNKPPLSSWTPTTDDAKVFAFMQLAIKVWHPDDRRIHFTGFSQGGAMTWRFICDHADVLASAAPGAGSGCAFSGAEMPSREIDILDLHGTKDALIDFDTVAVPQRDAVIAAWNMDAGTKIAGDATFTRTRYTSPSGTVLEFLQHDYAAGPCLVTIDGHCFPGSDDPGGLQGQACSFKCLPPNAFTWGEEVMQFFIAHPRGS